MPVWLIFRPANIVNYFWDTILETGLDAAISDLKNGVEKAISELKK
jgi:hypothetical protein